jgi:G3E family GTPase
MPQIDLVNEEEKANVRARIHGINSSVEIIECMHGRVDPDKLLDIKGFDLEEVLKMEPDFLNTDEEHQHDTSVSSVSFHHDEPVNLGQLQNWIQELLTTKGEQLLRYKGVINVMHMSRRFVFQGVSACLCTRVMYLLLISMRLCCSPLFVYA